LALLDRAPSGCGAAEPMGVAPLARPRQASVTVPSPRVAARGSGRRRQACVTVPRVRQASVTVPRRRQASVTAPRLRQASAADRRQRPATAGQRHGPEGPAGHGRPASGSRGSDRPASGSQGTGRPASRSRGSGRPGELIDANVRRRQASVTVPRVRQAPAGHTSNPIYLTKRSFGWQNSCQPYQVFAKY
jgi:hypothetical protein